MAAQNENPQAHPANQRRRTSMGQDLAFQHRASMGGNSFMKHLEFPADGPGRVIVRLERLMGSDRIRITDAKYMATLLQRLQGEEEVTMKKRTRERRKAEHNRFRQLVIDGLTEPTAAMADLQNHPVFRVNRILNRLSKLNNNVAPNINLPPIVPTEPFAHDESGRVFKLYPGHFSMSSLVKRTDSIDKPIISAEPQENPVQGESATYLYKSNSEHEGEIALDGVERQESGIEENKSGEFYSKMEDPEDIERENVSSTLAVEAQNSSGILPAVPSKDKKRTIGFSIAPVRETKSSYDDIVEDAQGRKVLTLSQIQKRYGIAPDTDLGVQWKPYQSPILDPLFSQQKKGVGDLYAMGREIVDMYDREQQSADAYIAALRKESDRIYTEKFGVNRYDNQDKDGDQEEEEHFDEEEEIYFDEDEERYSVEDEENHIYDSDNAPPLMEMDDYFNEAEEGDDDMSFKSGSPRNSQSGEARDSQPPTWDDLEEMTEEEATDEGEMEEQLQENSDV